MIKRCLDIVASAFGLAFLSPVFTIVAMAVRIDSHGPVFHRATRAGRYGVPFRMFKFRSMVGGAASMGPKITSGDDPRRLESEKSCANGRLTRCLSLSTSSTATSTWWGRDPKTRRSSTTIRRNSVKFWM